MGVIININQYDVDVIKDLENYILQCKVIYVLVIEILGEFLKCEICMLMFWECGVFCLVMVNNLAWLSKGLMVGVCYNWDKDWVGGSVGFFKVQILFLR